MTKKFELDDIVLIGRTFDEYYRMFNLGDISNCDNILDVASGVSSFCKEANSNGYNVTASDRIYCFSPSEIEKKCGEDLEIVLEKLPVLKDSYKWEYFEDIPALERKRKAAYKIFISDFKEKGNKKYVDVEFPQTSFKYNEFKISLVSHFLFLYDEHLDYEFHKKTILELIRITSGEIRIFPIINLRYNRSSFIDKIMKDPEFKDHQMEIHRVDYEFLKNGNEMLKIKVS